MQQGSVSLAELDPLVLLPSQLGEVVRPSSPETRLWYAALNDAIGICKNEIVARHYERKEAILWVASESLEFGSFEWCCSLFGVDPSATREAMIIALLPVETASSRSVS